MASSISVCRSCLARCSSSLLYSTSRPASQSHIFRLLPTIASQNFSTTFPTLAAKPTKSKSGKPSTVRKKAKTHFKIWNHADVDKFSLTDAIRYIRAFEVGKDPHQMKYELHVKIQTIKNGPTVKNRIRLPKAVKTDLRICVFAEGKQAQLARDAGAAVVGTQEIWEQIKKGEINFDRCICHSGVLAEFQKANLGRILGPRGLMPSPKTGTVVGNVAEAVTAMVGASEYRERAGVVRLAIGQLAFTPEELSENIKAFMNTLTKDLARIEDFDKRVNEVVLSSTNSPGFSLSGEFRSNVGKEGRQLPTEDEELQEPDVEEEMEEVGSERLAMA